MFSATALHCQQTKSVDLDPLCAHQVGIRYGEARHPGPAELQKFSLFATNPSGLRGKEATLLEHGRGIFLISETQLSVSTQKTCRGRVTAFGQASDRRLRTHFGQAAPLRANSDWAGSWTGVACISDFPSRQVQVQWPQHTFDTGRVAVVQNHVGPLPLLTAIVYGVPRSQAHSNAFEDTEHILRVLTREVVLGRHGPRVIAGDYNHPASASAEVAVWRAHGWQEIQELAFARWGNIIEMTCKGASRHDYVWLSPEAIALCTGSEVHHSFADHVVLEAKLQVPQAAGRVCTWPRPATIPWQDVNIPSWHSAAVPFLGQLAYQDPTTWYGEFTQHWEDSLSSHVAGPDGRLPGHCKGRASRIKPAYRDVAPSILKASRPGEVVIANDFLGREVKRWFQQLRRLQCLRDSLRAGKVSPQATLFRAQLWQSIIEAKGFTPSFAGWWPRRVMQLHGSPPVLTTLPDASTAQAIFEDFNCNYRKLENWHLKRREGILTAKHAESSQVLFATLRPAKPPPLDTLVLRHSFEVLAADAEACQIQLDDAPSMQGSCSFSVDGQTVNVKQLEGALCQVSAEDCALFPAGAVVEQERFISEPAQVFQEFIDLWQPRWNQHAELRPDHWQRILNFTRFLRPVASFDFAPIHSAQWIQAVRRLKKRAARGPDAYARLDLLHMAPCYVAQLVAMLNAIELGQVEWPQQLLQGFICAIDKQNQKTGADAYRPICLLSTVYRVWASIRTRQILRALRPHAPAEMFGFMPARETADMWLMLQAQIEAACAMGAPLSGCMADVVKAFNGLPRAPLLRAAARLGFPSQVLTPWVGFISQVKRRFLMGEHVSAAVHSSSGFIEGDPLSVTAMSVASVLCHRYMYEFEPRVQHASYVDNLAVTAETVYLTARGFTVMESFWELLGLQLDRGKTY